MPILAFGAVVAAAPLLVASNVVLNFLVFTMIIALAAQGWNLLGGYGGQYSFGHAAFFGTGAYVTAILQVRYGMNAYPAFAMGIALAALVGLAIGFMAFRSGLKGSYFALVTLAFAEVFRVLANAGDLTGGAAGIVREEFIRLARGLPKPGQGDNWLPADLAVVYGTGGTFDLLAWWLSSEADIDAQQIAGILHRLIIAPLVGDAYRG